MRERERESKIWSLLHLKWSHPWTHLMWFWPVNELRGMSESEAVWTQTHCGLGGTREWGGRKHGTWFDLYLLFMGNSSEHTITKSPVSSTEIDIPPLKAIFTGILMSIVHSGVFNGNVQYSICFYLFFFFFPIIIWLALEFMITRLFTQVLLNH